MDQKIDELRKMASVLLASDSADEEARKKWGENVHDLLQELSIYHFELEHQNAALEQSEQDLVASRAKYMELFENAPVGYVIIDRIGRIQQANRTFTELYVPHYPRDLVVTGRFFHDFISPEFHDAFRRFLNMLSKSGSILPMELKMLDATQKTRYASLTAGARRAGDPTFRIAVNDIHSRKKLEMQLLMAKEQATENDRAKSLFLTRINHELRTPLSVLSGFGEMLSEPDLTPETRKTYVSAIRDAAASMRVVADEVGDLSLLNRGESMLRYEIVNVEKICAEHVRIARNLIQGKTVSILFDSKEIPQLIGDPGRMETIVHSILRYALENAVDGGTIQMHGRYEKESNGSGTLLLELSGSGCAVQDRVEPDLPASDCSGLELFLARQILSFMNGSLTLLPAQNRLLVAIPLLAAPETKTEPAEEKTEKRGPTTCLLVDDVLMNLKVLAALMRKLGCVPVMADSGKEALSQLARTRVDLILTDLWMPQMNGMEFAMSVRQMPQYNDIPIVAVTADVGTRAEFRHALLRGHDTETGHVRHAERNARRGLEQQSRKRLNHAL